MMKLNSNRGRGAKHAVKTKRKSSKKILKKGVAAKKLKPTQEASKKVNAKLVGEEISSDSDSGVSEGKKFEDESSDDQETEQERRLRLAKKYLSRIEAEEPDNDEAVSHRLKQDNLDKSGQLHRKVADDCFFEDGLSETKVLKGHKLSVTCLVISSDDKYMFSGSKDGSIIKWCIESCKRLKVIPGGPKDNLTIRGHSSCVTSIALSTDSKFLASGDMDKIIRIWNPVDMTVTHNFTSHRGGITGLAFRQSSHQLFSSSTDRSVKIWNLDEMGYVESLFGHQDSITSLDSLLRDRALTSGGRDNTIRLWKVPEESQLVFQGNGGSIDCVCFINEQHFISGSDNGSISLWGLQKKKPLFTVSAAHKKQLGNLDENNWITAVTALPNSDLIASGSQDGFVRVWKCKEGFKGFDLKTEIPVVGFVNALHFGKSGSFLVAAVGQEHRCGRWWRIKEAKNSVVFIPLRLEG